MRAFDPSNASYGASCDGQQGYFFARCLVPPIGSAPASTGSRSDTVKPVRLATALHLPWPKFHPPSRRHGARLHSSLLHPHRPCRMLIPRPNLDIGGCGRDLELPPTWRWNDGHALLPFRFKIFGTHHASGLPSLTWEAYNRSALRVYNRLHVHREDDKYCDVLPCGVVAVPHNSSSRPPSVASARAFAMNATVCSSMQECVAGDGGRYFYVNRVLSQSQ